jgi:hypothetical protein
VKKKLHNRKRVYVLKESLTDAFKARETKMIKMDYFNSRLCARRQTNNSVWKLGNNYSDIMKKLKTGKHTKVVESKLLSLN